MNLNNLIESEIPFKHWEIRDCLNENALDENET